MSVTKSPFNNPRKIVCIHCQYERAIDDGIKVCPECGKKGLVHQYHLAPRMRRLRYWVWGELLMALFILGSFATALVPSPIQIILGATPLLLLIATLQGFIGIFIAGATFDRKGLHRNRPLRIYTWIGMTLSIMLFLSIGITILCGLLIELIFG